MDEIEISSIMLARQVPRLLAVATMLLFFFFSNNGLYAQEPKQAPEARIVVTGEGSVSVMPNYAQVTIGVTTRTKAVKEAIEINSKLMLAIIAALKGAGIAGNDIQTALLAIQPVYTPQEPRTDPKLSGYGVSNHVSATIRDIGNVGDVIDRAIAAGATDVGNVSFLVSNASKALDRAREVAIADARRKAEIYANAAGVQLGRVEWITEDTGSGSPAPMRAREAAALVPIESGENTLRVRVTVGFSIGP